MNYHRFVMNALKAKEFYRRDVQYIVRDGKALIINEVLLGIFMHFNSLTMFIYQIISLYCSNFSYLFLSFCD